MVNLIYMDESGHKKARPVTNREEYEALRNTAGNTKNFYDARKGDEKAKGSQVQFNYNDLLPDGVLRGCCHPASTFAHDIDCGSQEEQMRIKDILLARKEEIGLLELSGSAHYGLHPICRRQPGKTIRECQFMLSMATQTEYDTNARGLARVLFTGPATPDNLFYLDDAIFGESLTVEESAEEYLRLKEREERGLEEVPAEAKKANKHYRPWASPSPSGEGWGEGLHGGGAASPHFKGIPYTDIIREYWARTGGIPVEGERNVRLHKLAVNLRAICDNRRDVLMQVMPRLGLSEQEVQTIVDSACRETPKGVSKMMQGIILDEELRVKGEGLANDDENLNESGNGKLGVNLEELPIGLRESLVGVPESMHMPVLCAVLPIAAAYADGVEVEYCDGQRQRLGLMSIIRGEQASGKSVCKNAVEIWKRQFEEEDEIAHRREDEWKERRKGRKANEKAPEDPKVLIRMVPVTVSCSTLLKRLKNARGHTLYSFGEELDTLRKTNGAGSWSSKYDIYRLAFDNGKWGQDYNSDQAESGSAMVAYNWTMLGTNGAMQKCFRQDNIENGLSSRILVAEMPDSSFQRMPKFGRRSAEDEERIQEAVTMLRSHSGFTDTPLLREAIERWVEGKRVEAAKDIDHVKDIYRKRAAVIGFRCGVIHHLLSIQNSKLKIQNDASGVNTDEVKAQPNLNFEFNDFESCESKATLNFALLMAEYCLAEQIKAFGEALRNEYAVAREDCQRYGKNHSVFDRLPPMFTMGDLRALKQGFCGESALRTIIVRWKYDGWIEKQDAKHWRKVAK